MTFKWMDPWTQEEDDYLRAHYGAGRSAKPMARHLQRTAPAVRERCRKLGLKPRFPFRGKDAIAARLMYRSGKSDQDIADRLGCSVAAVWNWRTKAGLPAHGCGSARNREKQKKRSTEANPFGMKCRYEASLRWHCARKPSEADTLDALEHGPLTTAGLSKHCGIDRSWACRRLTSLVRRKLVVRVPNGRYPLYRIAPGVVRVKNRKETVREPRTFRLAV